MTNASDIRILIIGMGHIGGYLFPCYKALLGEKTSSNIVGVKGTEKDLEAKQKQFGFPIYVKENKRALEEHNPDLIIFSPRPSQVGEITTNVLKPYFASRREKGLSLPDIYAFAPDPPVTYYADVIGPDVNAVNIIPNMVDKIQNLYVAPIAYSMATFDPRRNWPEEKRKFVFEFMSPLGGTLDVNLDVVYPVLAAKLSAHSLYEINMIISDTLIKHGLNIGHNDTANAMRAIFRARFDTFSKDVYKCSRTAIDDRFRVFLQGIVNGWYDGIIDYCHDQGADSYISSRFIRGTMEMHLLTVQLETRDGLYYNNSVHATKGGILESSINNFNRQYAPLLVDGLERYIANKSIDDFWKEWHAAAYRLTATTKDFAANASKHY